MIETEILQDFSELTSENIEVSYQLQVSKNFYLDNFIYSPYLLVSRYTVNVQTLQRLRLA